MKSANILMDYTDLVSFFKRGLPITGIQRVVYEITSAIQADDLDCVITPIGITPFKRRLAPISAPMLELIEAYGRTNTVKGRSLVAKAVEELSYVRIFKNQPAAAADSSMPRSAPWLVMLGASWSRSNYAGIVSALKSANISCRKAILVHDMLPIEQPKLTFRSAHETFKRWIDLVLETADVIFTPSLARTVEDNGDVYFVPAFSGLYAPHWRESARGIIAGLTRYANKGHIARAALEATAYQTREVIEAMETDSGIAIKELRADGGMVRNDLLMQFQANLLAVPVLRPKVTETTALGAAYAAGLATGYWAGTGDLVANWGVDYRWHPRMDEDRRNRLYAAWGKAVRRSFGWTEATG